MRSSDARSETSPEDDPDAMADPAAAAITVVTVAHNSASVLPAMLASIPEGVPVIVVDNGSQDSDRIAPIAEQHGARLICNERNVGFGQACNQGAALADTPLVLFLNPDAELVRDTIDLLAEASCRYPEASAFNPAIELPNGAQFFKTSSPISPSRSKLPRGWPKRRPAGTGAQRFGAARSPAGLRRRRRIRSGDLPLLRG